MQTIRERILELAEPEYQAFQQKLCPGVDNILGIRVPLVRKLAKEVAKGDWRTYLRECPYEYYEELMLAGLVIGLAKMDIEERIGYVAGFVPRIDNWGVCDVVAAGLKPFQKHPERVYQFVTGYLHSPQEFEVRFGVVTLMNYFTNEAYLERLLQLYDSVRHPAYYVKMAVAWAVSLCYVRFPERTLRYLHACKLDDDTFNKALQKIIESRRITDADRDMIRGMKRRPAKK